MRTIRRIGLVVAALAFAGAASAQVTVSSTPSPLPASTVGASYSATLKASGGVSPHTFFVTTGSLPPGLTLGTPTVVDLTTTTVPLSGTPSTAGTFSPCTVTATDSALATGTLDCTITVNPAPNITTASPLPSTTVGAAYSLTFAATGGTGALSWSIAAGSLPAGLTLNVSTWALTGTPIAAGTTLFTVQVTDSVSVSKTKDFTLLVNPAPSITTSSPLPPTTVGASYSQTLAASGGTVPYTWSVTAGALPSGITLNAGSGALTGTPASAGFASFTVGVMDSVGISGTKPFTLTVNSAPTITTASPMPPTTVGATYTQTFAATGGTTPYTNWSLTAGSLPSGLNLNSATGVLSGTPVAAGTAAFTVKVTDSAGGSGTKDFSLTVNAPPTITTASPMPPTTVGATYNQTLAATGGTTPYTNWSVTVGSLPSGLALNSSTGAVTGVPASSGTASFTVQVTDTAGGVGIKSLTLTVNPPPGISTAPTLAGGTVGVAYTPQTLTATGGTTPYSWSITLGGLPTGLVLDPASGTISGTPTSAGTSSFTAQVTDAASISSTKVFSITISSGLTITTAPTLPGGTVNVAYSQTLVAAGGTFPYSWTTTAGALPSGITLNSSTGALSGTPSVAGTFSFTAQVTDTNTVSTTKQFSVTIAPALSITTAPTLSSGSVGVAYSQTLAATGGTSPYTWSVTVGALPAGLSLSSSTGVISGTPSAAGAFNFTVQATDTALVTATKDFGVTISAGLSITTAPTLPGGTVGSLYSINLNATGGSSPYTWSINSGALPGGVLLSSSTGGITGTPTAAGTFSFTVVVTDTASNTTNKAFTLVIAGGLSIGTAPTLPAGTVGVAYSQTFAASGGTPPYTWSITAGLLPGGLTFNPTTGAVSGSPSAFGTFSFTVQVTDSVTVFASKAFSLTIAPALTITNAPVLPSGSVGIAYSQTLNAAGGTAPFILSVTAGQMPAGLTLNASTGTIAGSPTSTGSFSFTVAVTDSTSATASKNFTISIFAGLTISTAPALPNGTMGTAYSRTLTAIGGSPPYTWNISAGALPGGVALDPATGTISGTPTIGGTFNFTAQVTDSLSSTTSKVFTLAIAGGLAITTAPTLPSDSVGVAYSETLAASGGTTPYTWSVTSGALPAGTSLNAVSGIIAGTPTGAGNFTFTVQVIDNASVTVTKTFTLSIAAGLTITNAPTLPGGTAGVAFSQTLVAVGGASPYTWSITVGSLPGGLSLNPSTGAITGTPASGGTFNFTAQVTDSASVKVTKAFTLVVAASLNIITAPVLPSGSVSIAYSVNLGATGGTAPYSWSITTGALPNGLALDSATGAISGTPTSAGDVTFTVRVTDSAAITFDKQFTLNIAAGLTISTAPALPIGTIGVPYSQTLVAVGGKAPYSWSITAGSLAGGMALNPSSGAVTGTPTSGGSVVFTVRVTDSASVTATKSFSFSVTSGLTIVTAPTLPNGSVGIPYGASVTAAGGSPPYTWSITSGALPPGITLDPATGSLAGSTAASGTFGFTAQVTDNSSVSATKQFSFFIASGLTIATAPGLANGTLGVTYNTTLAAVGGSPPYSWSVLSGALPGGLVLNPGSGIISGVPTGGGEFTFTIVVSDSSSVTAAKPFTLTIAAGLTITNAPALPNGTLGAAYSQALVAVGGTAPYAWSVTAGSLPAGLALNSATGLISGTPSAPGTFAFTAHVIDSASISTSKLLSLTISSDLIITTTVPIPDGLQGAAYSLTLVAAGGKPPYAWSITAGTLPAGVTLSAGGVLSGTPTAAGDFTFTVKVTDNAGNTFAKQLTLHVSLPGLPQPTVTGLPDSLNATQQSIIDITLASAFPAVINGQMDITFQPDSAAPVDDPALQFSSGGRTATFTVPANTTQAIFQTPQMALQVGTVAGTITVTIKLTPSGATSPAVTLARTVNLARSAPGLRSVTLVRTGSGFEVHVIGWSTPRDLTNAQVHFTAAAGQNLQTSDLSVSLAAAGQQWFGGTASALYGSQFQLVLPFSLQGSQSAVGGVSVVLTNSAGTSASVSAGF